MPPGRGLALAQGRVGPDGLAQGLALGGAVLAMQREERAPDVDRAVEIAPGAVGAALARLGPGLLDDHAL